MPMRLAPRIALAAVVFVAVAWLPHRVSPGVASNSTDLGLSHLLSLGSIWSYAVAFAGGVLTSLTPCVYPLIPITVSVLGVRPGIRRSQAMALSGLYVLGIAITYSALGAGAALTGKAFGSVMQSPWAIGGVALVFAAMALSLLGAFEVRLPMPLQSRLARVGGAGLAGALAMGLVAGIIAAPCTGPVLAAALSYVATRGSVLFGFSILFAYALGIGVLFFLIGTFSLSLPKSGPWMETVKGLFGVTLLVAAGLFLKDVLPGVKPLFLASRPAVFAAAATAAVGILLGALQATFSGSRLESAGKALGLVLTVGGIIYTVGAADARERTSTIQFTWLQDEPQALTRARAEGRPLIVDFWADWCAACKELDRTAWADPRVREELKRFVALKLDGTTDSPAFQAAAAEYGVVGLPTIVLIDSRGRELPERITSVISGDEMLKKLRTVDQACVGPLVACVARW